MADQLGSIARAPIKFGNTTIFADALAQMIGFQIVEDEYAPNEEGQLEREVPYAVLFFPLGTEISLDGEDFSEFKDWLTKNTRKTPRIELADQMPAGVGSP